MTDHFFQVSKSDPLLGFSCDLTSIVGCVVGPPAQNDDLQKPLYLRLLLGSHLARYLRLKIEEDFGYTSTCGISTNKLLSKLVGSKNKPQSQTTLLALKDEDVVAFIDGHKLRQIPGLGSKMAQILENHITGKTEIVDSHSFESITTAEQIRSHPGISSGSIESLLGGPGAEKGIGARVWALLHGVDPIDIKEASDVPSQISIEDTYKGLETLAEITQELHKLAFSLIRRLRVDLLAPDENNDDAGAQKWIARPRTLRLSIRSLLSAGSRESLNYNRVSRSSPLPNFVFDLKTDMDALADRLVSEALLPLMRRLQTEKNHKWNLQLINVCAASMAVGAAEDRFGAGRDIANMFKKQDEVLRPWRVVPDPEIETEMENSLSIPDGSVEADDPAWAADENPTCRQCGQPVPAFALSAHLRFHELEDSGSETGGKV